MDHKPGNRIMLVVGLALVACGLMFLLLQSSEGLVRFLMQMWPIFLIFAGLARLAGFAIDRRPRSPLDGMLLVAVGMFFLIARARPELNVLQIYGRFWIMLVALFGFVEVVRFYSHRQASGPTPRVFSPWRIAILLFIIITGVAANRVGNDPSAMRRLRLPVSAMTAGQPDGFVLSLVSVFSANRIRASRARQTMLCSFVNRRASKPATISEELLVA